MKSAISKQFIAKVIFLGMAFFATGQNVGGAETDDGHQETITNLMQLGQSFVAEQRLVRDVRLEVTVCEADVETGTIIARDESGVELLELGRIPDLSPGEQILIKQKNCFLRKREMGVELSANLVVNNDGAHIARTVVGQVTLRAGRVPFELDWFNRLSGFNLEVSCERSNQNVTLGLFHLPDGAPKNASLLPGLRVDCFEAEWESVPDFSLLQAVKTGTQTNIDLTFRSRDEMVGLRFTGVLDVFWGGTYTFKVRSDDGSLLFLGDPIVPIKRSGATNALPPMQQFAEGGLDDLKQKQWAAIEGRISFFSRVGKGAQLELHSGGNAVLIRIANAAGLKEEDLLNAKVKIGGVAVGAMTVEKNIVLGQLLVLSSNDVICLEKPPGKGDLSLPLANVAQVQGLRIEDARRGLAVSISGVVTSQDHHDNWMSIQDDTRGIFVEITNSLASAGEFWEVTGHTAAGDFAPIVVADTVSFMGRGRLPEPARPTWNQLINGSMDVQWVEFRGLVTEVHSNRFALLLPEGRLNVQMDGFLESDLKPFYKSVIRLRGVLFAVWDSATREVRVGELTIRNGSINVDKIAEVDPFDVPMKKPRDLFLFDARATPFQRVKIEAQVVHADAGQIFLMADGLGVRALTTEAGKFHAGDLVEAAGYPEISGPAPVLREAVIRKTGSAPLPLPQAIDDSQLGKGVFDSTLVKVEGILAGQHMEQNSLVYEVQSKSHLFLARLSSNYPKTSLRNGSGIALSGVYVAQWRERVVNDQIGSFELLLNSSDDVIVLRTPPWWTLGRLFIVIGILLAALTLSIIWMSQLRRQVALRTRQLNQEIRERERIERRHALEAERSRIARDLHDDLGSSLTEISVLASTGRHTPAEGDASGILFRAISSKAYSLISALDVIVWAVDPEANSLQSLADYLNGYVNDYLSSFGISCRFRIPVTFPAVILEGKLRHDVFLAVKETLNNIVKHAKATEVEFRMSVTDDIIHINVNDNGQGFDTSTVERGHGIENLSTRLASLGGNCTVTSEPGKGTSIKMSLPLPKPQE